ncbi:MAG: metallophosphoesterase family protein, partial [Planctomycetota bacterium]
MRLAWTSDLHLNHAALPAWESWIDSLLQARPDAILICGDISEAEDVEFQLRRMAEELKLPLFFVLGNHDFYASSIATTRQTISALARDLPSLVYLTDQQPISIGEQCYLVG